MNQTSTHFFVPIPQAEREQCLGPDGAVAHVTRMMRMIQGRWKLPILFRLYADPALRTLQLKRDLPGVSQKMLTQHLRELAQDGLIERVDFAEKSLRVEYRLSAMGKQLLPVLVEMRRFSLNHPDQSADLGDQRAPISSSNTSTPSTPARTRSPGLSAATPDGVPE